MNRLGILALPIGLLALWSLASYANLIDPLFLPSPWAVLISLYYGLRNGGLARDILETTKRAMAGFALSSLVGIPLGLLTGRIPTMARAIQPTMDFFRSVPATAIFPLFLLFFGVGDIAKIAVVVYASSLIILVNTAYGALQVKEARILSAKLIGADRMGIFWKIVVPESSPAIFAGLRIALSLSFVLVIVTEMFIGTTVGLGYRIVDAQSVYRTPDMYVGIILGGAIGFLANWCLLKVEGKLLHWVGK